MLIDLSTIASTVFAAYVAIYIFQGWVIQKRLESLSSMAKDKIVEITEVAGTDLNLFLAEVLDLINRVKIDQKNSNIKNSGTMEKISENLLNHPFFEFIMTFDVVFGEIKTLIPKADLKIYQQLSKDIHSLKKIVLVSGILNITILRDLNVAEFEEEFEELIENTRKSLSVFLKKLHDYKNYNY